jgi:hypothetical protein
VEYLADDALTGFWYGQANMNGGKRVGTYFGALEAFLPGELALSGDLERGKRLEESCFKMWTKWGIEPELLNYSNMIIAERGMRFIRRLSSRHTICIISLKIPATWKCPTRSSMALRNTAEPMSLMQLWPMLKRRQKRIGWKVTF